MPSGDDVVVVTDVLVAFVLCPDDDLLGLVHVGGSDGADLSGHGSGEEQEVALTRYLREDRLQTLGEAHSEHLIGFVEDHRLDGVETSSTSLHEVYEATRGSHDDLHPTT